MTLLASDKPVPSALITGATRGIGLGVARRLAELGWRLTLSARDANRLDEVALRLSDLGAPSVQVSPGDIAADDSLERLIHTHASAYGSLNALILAAGVGSAAPIAGYPMHRFDKQFAVNVRAPFALISSALPLLRDAAHTHPGVGARIVALSSMEGLYPEAGLGAYGASKAALVSIMQSVNAEEAAHGITATAISPGYVDTDMSAWVRDRIPAEEMITVEDVVKTVELILAVSGHTVLPHVVMSRRGAPYSA